MRHRFVNQKNRSFGLSAPFYFCDRPDALATIDLKSVPREKREAIRALHNLDGKRNAAMILFFFWLWAVAAWTALRWEHFAVRALSFSAIVCSMVGFSVLVHEASHRLLFRCPVLNQWFGVLCGLPVLLSVSGFRTNHLAHHDRRGSAADPSEFGANFRDSTGSTFFYYLSILIRAYGFLVYLPVIGLTQGPWKARVKTLLEYGLMASCCAIAFRLFPTRAVVNLWIVPLLISAHLAEVRAVAEHGLTSRGNVFTATRTVISNRLVSFVMCNINYHLEHHLFPGVPWRNLPEVSRLLREEYFRAGCSVYDSYTGFFLDFLKASWAGIRPNARLIPEAARKAMEC